jgi:hypothetical protein
VRAYLAVATSIAAWLVVEVGVFASRYVGRIAERDLIALAPVLFLALAIWLRRGAPRRYWAMSFVAIAVAAPLSVLPLGRFVTSYAPPDAPTLTALYDLRRTTSLATLEIVFFVGAAVAIALFALLPRRVAALLPILLVVALVGGSVAAAREASAGARNRQATYLGPDPRWIDHAAHGPVALLYTRQAGWIGIWESLFWNRRIDSVLGLDGAKVFGPVPTRSVRLRADGRLVASTGPTPAPRYVVAPLGQVETVPAYGFAGSLVAFVRRPGSPTGGSALWRIDPPLRLAFRTSGLEPNGDLYAGNVARLVAYGCNPRGRFRITLLIKGPQTVTILRNGTVYRRLRFDSPTPNQPWRAAIPTRRRPGTSACTLDVRSNGLLGTTVFEAD